MQMTLHANGLHTHFLHANCKQMTLCLLLFCYRFYANFQKIYGFEKIFHAQTEKEGFSSNSDALGDVEQYGSNTKTENTVVGASNESKLWERSKRGISQSSAGSQKISKSFLSVLSHVKGEIH